MEPQTNTQDPNVQADGQIDSTVNPQQNQTGTPGFPHNDNGNRSTWAGADTTDAY